MDNKLLAYILNFTFILSLISVFFLGFDLNSFKVVVLLAIPLVSWVFSIRSGSKVLLFINLATSLISIGWIIFAIMWITSDGNMSIGL